MKTWPALPFGKNLVILSEEGDLIYDPVRRNSFVCTSEEYVRQNLMAWLQVKKGFPLGLMSIERQMKLEAKGRRYDFIVLDRAGLPLVLCECKAYDISIGRKDVIQASVYNQEIRAKYVLLSNGLQTLFIKCCEDDTGHYTWKAESDIPNFEELLQRKEVS
jgi:hypothetical protein